MRPRVCIQQLPSLSISLLFIIFIIVVLLGWWFTWWLVNFFFKWTAGSLWRDYGFPTPSYWALMWLLMKRNIAFLFLMTCLRTPMWRGWKLLFIFYFHKYIPNALARYLILHYIVHIIFNFIVIITTTNMVFKSHWNFHGQ